MLSTLTLAALIVAAPVPKDAKPAGPAPRVVELAADPDGKVRITVTRTENRKVMSSTARVVNGQPMIERVEREVPYTRAVQVELTEVKELQLYTADGKVADKALALKKLNDGGVVIVSSDGQKVDQKYLRLFRDDVLVMVSPELTGAARTTTTSPFRTAVVGGIGVAPGGGFQPLPALPIQIQPAVPLPAPLPAPAPVPPNRNG